MSEEIAVTMRELEMIAAYNKAHNATTYVMHTPSKSTIGGFSAEFVCFLVGSAICILKHANGDLFRAPLSQVTISVSF